MQLVILIWAARSRWLAGLLLGAAVVARGGDELTAVLSGPAGPVAAGEPVAVWLNLLNTSTREALGTFPVTLPARLVVGATEYLTSLEIREPSGTGGFPLPPGAFARREYRLSLPSALAGTVWLEGPGLNAGRIALEVRPAAGREAVTVEEPGMPALAQHAPEGEATTKGSCNPNEFFKQHFFGYEPFYMIAGTEAPNAKFQVSFRYQILNREGALAQTHPMLNGLNVAYTQTSLWDWSAPSAPFYDSSYKPEMLYLWEQVDRGGWADWVRLDLQGGLQHESNGQSGDESRSLNILYFRPTVVLGRTEALQLTLSPQVWCYIGGLEDNPDVADYRGYADLRAILGWKGGLQLMAMSRLGDGGHHGSLQLDLTYPMMRLLSGSLSLYLQAQYFTGYGESLLNYNQKSDAFRLGFSIYR